MKKIFTILLFNYLTLSSFSQENMTYKGKYKGSQTTGEVEYEYCENEDFERIYNGFFKYNAIEYDYGLNLLIIGNYKENKKHGNWIFKLSSKQPSNFNSSVSGEYYNGNLNGNWTFKRTKTVNVRGISENVTDLSTCNFSNNKFFGEFKYEMKGVKIEGSFDSNGFFDGIWKVNWKYEEIPYEEIRSYKNGFCYKSIYRNLSNGQIINKFDNSGLLNSFLTNNIINDTTILINESEYKIELVDKKEIDNTIYEDIYNENYEGLRHIYNALGFWICSRSMDCHFFMSTVDVQFVKGNYIYEINYGINTIDFVFEKKITSINK